MAEVQVKLTSGENEKQFHRSCYTEVRNRNR